MTHEDGAECALLIRLGNRGAVIPGPEIRELEENRNAAVSDIHFKWRRLPKCLVTGFRINIQILKNGLTFNSHTENALAGFVVTKFHKAEFYRNPLRTHRNLNCKIAGACGLIDLAAAATDHWFRIKMRKDV